jgi:hypothetical protein
MEVEARFLNPYANVLSIAKGTSARAAINYKRLIKPRMLMRVLCHRNRQHQHLRHAGTWCRVAAYCRWCKRDRIAIDGNAVRHVKRERFVKLIADYIGARNPARIIA